MKCYHYIRGVTLLDTLVGVALIGLVVVGITGVIRLSVDVVTNNKARTGAVALAGERMEFIRSLSYDDVATEGGIPAGDLEQEEALSFNGVSYTRRTLIIFMDDPADGEGSDDQNGTTADSKLVRVSVEWQSKGGARSAVLVSRVSPKSIETSAPGGTLSIKVVDAGSQALASAEVRVVNNSASPVIDVTSFTNSDGNVKFIGSPEASGYEITVTRENYSTAGTYDATSENPNPQPGHLTVSEGLITSATFAIDALAGYTFNTFELPQRIDWIEPFTNSSGIASSSKIVTASGVLRLTGPGGQNSPGFALLDFNAPSSIGEWVELSWVDDEPPDTSVTYFIYYDNAGEPEILPDAALPGNSAGFTASPVDLSGISASTYPSLTAYILLESNDTGSTPSVDSLTMSHKEALNPLPNVLFTLTGTKTIGTDGGGTPIPKYQETHDSNVQSSVSELLEWDTYTPSINGVAEGFDLAESCDPSPYAVSPGQPADVNLFFAPHTNNSLRVTIVDSSGAAVEGASVSLTRDTFSANAETSVCGQAFFSGLSSGTIANGNPYSISISKDGYQNFSDPEVDVSGASGFSAPIESL